MTTDLQTQLLGDPKEVDVVAIERELVTLWKDASGGTADPNSAPVVRACSLNFIVVTEDEKEVDELTEMVGEVTLEHPARIFLVAANRRSGTPKLDAWISARCSLPVPGGKQVCCEQINLTASGADANKIPSIVTSLLVSDVPSVLLWKGRVDANDSILQSLAQVVDRILIDSSEDASPETSLLAWCGFIKAHSAHTTFGDLAWTHLTAWRSVVANAFNPSEMRAHLANIASLTIEYSSTSAPRHSGLSQSLLLASWVTQKLKWLTIQKFTQSRIGAYSAKLRLDEQAINIRVVPSVARKGFPGSIESVAIRTNAGLNVKFVATEHHDCVLFSQQLNGKSSDELLTVMSDKGEALLVAQELEVVTRDAGYEAVLKTLADLLKS
jgi:glucose-6-phosphate dehydrogenase assembly protein OpcA